MATLSPGQFLLTADESPNGYNPVRGQVMANDVVSGYGRGQYQRRTGAPVPFVFHLAAWLVVLCALFALGDRLARALG